MPVILMKAILRMIISPMLLVCQQFVLLQKLVTNIVIVVSTNKLIIIFMLWPKTDQITVDHKFKKEILTD